MNKKWKGDTPVLLHELLTAETVRGFFYLSKIVHSKIRECYNIGKGRCL